MILLLLITSSAVAQKKSEQTKSFRVTGEVKEEKKITIDDFPKYRESSLGDVVITNHAGEVKSTQRKLKGILLRDVLEKVEIKSESPRALSEFYIVCKASDGYTIVFSWNEIFNNPAGESVYLITSKDGVTVADLDESILMTSPRDYKTGRRYLKGLTIVEIKRIQ
ncbi:MAG: hypothetical protein J0L67_03415 [Cytophagales bacterium]|nr:hypothetical protein [Cytophagales bacterium]